MKIPAKMNGADNSVRAFNQSSGTLGGGER